MYGPTVNGMQYVRIEDWEHAASTAEAPGQVFEITLSGGTYSDEKFSELYRMIGDLVDASGFNVSYDSKRYANDETEV